VFLFAFCAPDVVASNPAWRWRGAKSWVVRVCWHGCSPCVLQSSAGCFVCGVARAVIRGRRAA
jgi:hypothetical protein